MMKAPANPARPPMAEPGKRPSGADVGGVRAAAETGVAEAAQRSSERGAEPRVTTTGRPSSAPSTASAPSTPATRATGIAVVEAGAKRNNDDEEDEWRHEPIAPVDERNPLKSLGKAVSDAVLGADDGAPATPER